MGFSEEEKEKYRQVNTHFVYDIDSFVPSLVFEMAEADAMRDLRKRLTTDDFEPIALIGRGWLFNPTWSLSNE